MIRRRRVQRRLLDRVGIALEGACQVRHVHQVHRDRLLLRQLGLEPVGQAEQNHQQDDSMQNAGE